MSVREARANFSELLGTVHYTAKPVIIERRGKPYAVVITPWQYEAMEREIERLWSTVDKVRERNADKDPDEVLRDVTKIVEAVRQEIYHEEQKTAKRRR